MRNILREESGIEYVPFLYSTGLFDRAWPELKDAVEQHWTPYIDASSSLTEAARVFVGALANS